MEEQNGRREWKEENGRREWKKRINRMEKYNGRIEWKKRMWKEEKEEENARGEPFRDPKMFSEHETWRKLTRNVKLFKS